MGVRGWSGMMQVPNSTSSLGICIAAVHLVSTAVFVCWCCRSTCFSYNNAGMSLTAIQIITKQKHLTHCHQEISNRITWVFSFHTHLIKMSKYGMRHKYIFCFCLGCITDILAVSPAVTRSEKSLTGISWNFVIFLRRLLIRLVRVH